MTLPTVTVSGSYEDADGNPAVGTVTFRLSTHLLDSSSKRIVPKKKITVALDASGSFSKELVATSGADIEPAEGVFYTVTERIDGAPLNRYHIALPASDPIVDLAAAAPIDATPVVWTAAAAGLMSPSQILAALVTVDGAGSGIDADTVDGNEASVLLDRANHTGTQTASTISDFAAAVSTAVGSSFQPLDSDLTAIAALATTTFGRSLLTLVDAAAGRTALGLGTAASAATGDFQAADADLSAIAALTTTSYGRAFLALADAAAARTALALGSAAVAATGDFDAAGAAAAAQAASQPLDSDLTAIAALTTTSFGRSFLALADATAGRTLLGLGTAATSASSAFQAADSDLTAIAALTTTAFGRALLELADAAALRTAAGVVADALVAHLAGAESFTGLKTFTAGLLSSSGTQAVGYTTGAGGTVTQATSRSTAVTINKPCGQITMNAASLAAGAEASFTVNNSTVAATDTVNVSLKAITTGTPMVYVSAVNAGSFQITISNLHASTADTSADVINFAVLKAVSA